MEVRACRSCGKMFNYLTGVAICESCKKKREELFQKVKNYIREHKGATIDQICEDNEVSAKLIKQWIKEERLTFDKDSPITLECEHCGAPIRTGRFCEACKAKLGNKVDSFYDKPQPRETFSGSSNNNGMHFLK